MTSASSPSQQKPEDATAQEGSQHQHDGEGESSMVDLPASPLGSPPDRVVITNPNVTVTLPIVQYGYRTEKAKWSELVQIVNVDRDIPRLSRSQQQQHHYEVFRYHLKEQYQSGTDYILITKFGYESVLDPKNGKWQAVMPPSNISSDDVPSTQKILILNDFPYYVEDSVVHYVLWKTKGGITESDIVDARKELVEKIHAVDIVYWTNPLNLQSIPEIDHVHFLCLLPKVVDTK